MGAEGRSNAEQQHMVDALSATELDPTAFAERELALLRYADKLTRDPASMRPDDVEALRAVGFDDLAIHDACAIVAYYAFVNRIADGLGVELEA
jgi:uncharacterized peroxidase-related enzyme